MCAGACVNVTLWFCDDQLWCTGQRSMDRYLEKWSRCQFMSIPNFLNAKDFENQNGVLNVFNSCGLLISSLGLGVSRCCCLLVWHTLMYHEKIKELIVETTNNRPTTNSAYEYEV